MALFDFIKGRPVAPKDIIEALLQAVKLEDKSLLAELCQEYRLDIRKSFKSWLQIPELIKNNPRARGHYIQGLFAVAQMFEQDGDLSLITLLEGNNKNSQLTAWEQDFLSAQSLLNGGRIDNAIKLLQSAIMKNAKSQESGANYYLAKAHIMLGAAFFHAGNKSKAIWFTENARKYCSDSGDGEGVGVCVGNLLKIEEGEKDAILRNADGQILIMGKHAATSVPQNSFCEKPEVVNMISGMVSRVPWGIGRLPYILGVVAIFTFLQLAGVFAKQTGSPNPLVFVAIVFSLAGILALAAMRLIDLGESPLGTFGLFVPVYNFFLKIKLIGRPGFCANPLFDQDQCLQEGRRLIEQFPTMPDGYWQSAEALVAKGHALLHADRQKAMECLQDAREIYNELLERFSVDTTLCTDVRNRLKRLENIEVQRQ